jgi:hypothetical protein
MAEDTPPLLESEALDDLPLAITRAVEEVESKQEAAPQTAPSTTPAYEGQPRNADGTYGSKGVPSAPAPAPSAPTTGSPAAPASPPEEAPATWKPEVKALWARVPPEVRNEVTRREREADTAMRSAAERTRAASAVMAEFEPYAEILHQEGATPIAAIRTLLQTAYALRAASPEYKKAIFIQLAHQYDVDLASGFDENLAVAQGRLTQHDIAERERAAYYANEQARQADEVIGQFRSLPGHEHFDKVRPIMGQLLNTGTCQTLEQAYQQAIVLHPDLRDYVVNLRAQQIIKHQQAEQAKRRNASSSVGGSLGGYNGGGNAASPGGSLRDSLNAAYDRLNGG